MALFVRPISKEEQTDLEALRRSRTGGAALASRAAIILRSAQGEKVPAIAQGIGVCQATVRARLHRFNEAGPEGLRDRAGSGRRPVYSEVERSRVIQLALSSPKELGKPFCHWTLDLLQEALEQEGCAMRRGRIHQVLRAEGVKWQKERTWFTSPDPEFAIKRGRSLASTSIPLRAAT